MSRSAERERVASLRANQRGCEAAAEVLVRWLEARGYPVWRPVALGYGALRVGAAHVGVDTGPEPGPRVRADFGPFSRAPGAPAEFVAFGPGEKAALEAEAFEALAAARLDAKPCADAAEVLARAARLVRAGWCRGAMARAHRGFFGGEVDADADEAAEWCALGAIARESWGDGALYDEAAGRLAEAVDVTAGPDRLVDVGGWQDAPERTLAEVVEALERAASLALPGEAA